MGSQVVGLANAKAVFHVADTGDGLDQILGPAFFFATVYGAAQDHRIVLNLYTNLAGINTVVIGEAVADVLPDPIGRATIITWSLATMAATIIPASVAVVVIIIVEPRRDFVFCPVPPVLVTTVASVTVIIPAAIVVIAPVAITTIAGVFITLVAIITLVVTGIHIAAVPVLRAIIAAPVTGTALLPVAGVPVIFIAVLIANIPLPVPV